MPLSLSFSVQPMCRHWHSAFSKSGECANQSITTMQLSVARCELWWQGELYAWLILKTVQQTKAGSDYRLPFSLSSLSLIISVNLNRLQLVCCFFKILKLSYSLGSDIQHTDAPLVVWPCEQQFFATVFSVFTANLVALTLSIVKQFGI